MTVPSSRPELDTEPDDELELSRITALVGELLIDVGVPSRVSISAVVFDVIELANEQLSARTDQNDEFENAEGRWTFARLTGSTIDPDRSLAEAGVYDGELLLVHQVGASESSVLVDEVEGIAESHDRRAVWFSEHGWMTGWFAISVALSAATASTTAESGHHIAGRHADRRDRGAGGGCRMRRCCLRDAVPIW